MTKLKIKTAVIHNTHTAKDKDKARDILNTLNNFLESPEILNSSSSYISSATILTVNSSKKRKEVEI